MYWKLLLVRDNSKFGRPQIAVGDLDYRSGTEEASGVRDLAFPSLQISSTALPFQLLQSYRFWIIEIIMTQSLQPLNEFSVSHLFKKNLVVAVDFRENDRHFKQQTGH